MCIQQHPAVQTTICPPPPPMKRTRTMPLLNKLIGTTRGPRIHGTMIVGSLLILPQTHLQFRFRHMWTRPSIRPSFHSLETLQTFPIRLILLLEAVTTTLTTIHTHQSLLRMSQPQRLRLSRPGGKTRHTSPQSHITAHRRLDPPKRDPTGFPTVQK